LLESLAAGTPVLARDVGDVASVTDNTFDSDKELENRLTNLESIPLEDVSPFTPEHLEPAYRDFFQDW
jgi:glycosyltransferase involved in cell wall biosynthesis